MKKMPTLEDELSRACDETGLSRDKRGTLNDYLLLLRNKHALTYEHSVRVGLLLLEIAKVIGKESQELLFAGALHDIGKLEIDKEIMQRSGTPYFTPQDFQEMKRHVRYGYEMIKPAYPLTAEIILRHHRFQKELYPETLPENQFSATENLQIIVYAEMIAIADFYDAMTTRVNGRFCKGKIALPEETREIMLATHQNQQKLITRLFDSKVFK